MPELLPSNPQSEKELADRLEEHFYAITIGTTIRQEKLRGKRVGSAELVYQTNKHEYEAWVEIFLPFYLILEEDGRLSAGALQNYRSWLENVGRVAGKREHEFSYDSSGYYQFHEKYHAAQGLLREIDRILREGPVAGKGDDVLSLAEPDRLRGLKYWVFVDLWVELLDQMDRERGLLPGFSWVTVTDKKTGETRKIEREGPRPSHGSIDDYDPTLTVISSRLKALSKGKNPFPAPANPLGSR